MSDNNGIIFHPTSIVKEDWKHIDFDLKTTVLSIPETFVNTNDKHMVIHQIGKKYFMGCDKLQMVVIPKTVYYIQCAAFAGCTNLRQIVLPANIHIDEFAFADCINLSRVYYLGSMDEWRNRGIKIGNIALTKAELVIGRHLI